MFQADHSPTLCARGVAPACKRRSVLSLHAEPSACFRGGSHMHSCHAPFLFAISEPEGWLARISTGKWSLWPLWSALSVWREKPPSRRVRQRIIPGCEPSCYFRPASRTPPSHEGLHVRTPPGIRAPRARRFLRPREPFACALERWPLGPAACSGVQRMWIDWGLREVRLQAGSDHAYRRGAWQNDCRPRKRFLQTNERKS